MVGVERFPMIDFKEGRIRFLSLRQGRSLVVTLNGSTKRIVAIHSWLSQPSTGEEAVGNREDRRMTVREAVVDVRRPSSVGVTEGRPPAEKRGQTKRVLHQVAYRAVSLRLLLPLRVRQLMVGKASTSTRLSALVMDLGERIWSRTR